MYTPAGRAASSRSINSKLSHGIEFALEWFGRGLNPNLVEGQFGKMPGTMKEHNMSMQSIFTRQNLRISLALEFASACFQS